MNQAALSVVAPSERGEVATEPLSALCYMSLASDTINAADVHNLVIEAREFNQFNNITGLLSIYQGKFFQYIEGPESALRSLYKRIEVDSRHRLIKTVFFKNPNARRFTDWSMMRADPSFDGISTVIDSISNTLQAPDGSYEDDPHAQSDLLALIDCLGENPLRHRSESDHVGRKVIAIGASAGGIAAIKVLLGLLPNDIDASILLVVHLSPDHETLLHTILERETGFCVRLAKEGDLVVPGVVHLIPPAKNLELVHGKIHLSNQIPRKDLDINGTGNEHNMVPHPIDMLFSSVANQYGRKAIAIILSGSGDDGTVGAKRLQESGAIVLAQSPESAEFPSMPQSAIDALVVNRCLAPEEMARFVSSNINIVNRHPDAGLSDSENTEISRILDALAEDHADFRHYKRKTIANRIFRRMTLLELRSLNVYRSLVAESKDERAILTNDLLICVTNFFRDFRAWESLKNILRNGYLDKMRDQKTVRVWVAGCATGEEAYTIAIVLHELLEEVHKPTDFKIFATDLSDSSLEATKRGVYKSSLLRNFPKKQLDKYFVHGVDTFRVRGFIRERVIAAKHNMCSDAPFTNMDIVCCRNVVIYMDQDLQTQVMKVLHFALQKDGLLFLGPSESTGALVDEYKVVDNRWNIHAKLTDKKIPLRLDKPPTPVLRNTNLKSESYDSSRLITSENAMYRKSIEALCQAQEKTALVLSGRNAVELVISDSLGLLEVASGQPGAVIEKLLVNSLVPTIVVNLQHLMKLDEKRIVARNIECSDNHNSKLTIDMEIVRLDKDSVEESWLLTFEKTQTEDLENRVSLELVSENDFSPDHSGNVDSLKKQIALTKSKHDDTKKVLFETVQELEKSNQEQQDAFEQLTTTNEELQSTNEELQSVNEELYTVNFEYQSKLHEFSDLSNDMNNLMKCTNLGVVFIGSDYSIRRYTEQAAKLTRLLPSDLGQSVASIARQLKMPDLEDRISRVMSLSKSYECDIDFEDCPGRLHIGIYPYKIDSELAQGAMLTMLDLANLRSFSVEPVVSL